MILWHVMLDQDGCCPEMQLVSGKVLRDLSERWSHSCTVQGCGARKRWHLRCKAAMWIAPSSVLMPHFGETAWEKNHFSGEGGAGERQSKKWEKPNFFVPSADTRAFVQCCFSTDYTDFSGSMTYFSAALPPPPPSWTLSESVIMCLLCIFCSCLGDGSGDSERYLTSLGLAMNNTQCVWDQPLFKHPAPGTQQVPCEESPANSF